MLHFTKRCTSHLQGELCGAHKGTACRGRAKLSGCPQEMVRLEAPLARQDVGVDSYSASRHGLQKLPVWMQSQRICRSAWHCPPMSFIDRLKAAASCCFTCGNTRQGWAPHRL